MEGVDLVKPGIKSTKKIITSPRNASSTPVPLSASSELITTNGIHPGGASPFAAVAILAQRGAPKFISIILLPCSTSACPRGHGTMP